MTYSREYKKDGDCLHITLHGDFPREAFEKTENVFAAIAAACKEYECTRALIDSRELNVHLTFLETLRAADDFHTIFGTLVKIAFVVTQEQLDPVFENTVVNKGAFMRVTTDMDTALAWLETTKKNG